MKVKSVTEKINELLKLSSDNDSDAEESTLPRVVYFEKEEYDLPDAQTTDFRKRNVKLLSEQSSRYKGKITSRKELQGESDDSEDAIDLPKNDYNSDKDNSVEENESSDEHRVDVESEENEESDQDDGSYDDDEDDEEEVDTKADVIAEENRQAEIQKGVCVQNQLRVWERLLEFRIHSQKLLNKTNQLPSPSELHQNDDISSAAKEVTEKTCLLLKSLLGLKSTLISQFSELRNHLKRPLKENAVLSNYENGEPPLKRIAIQLENQHNEMRSYRNNVLLKWDDRTKLLTPGAGAKKKMHEEFDIVHKIENALLNKDTLIAKSQKILNAKSTNENDDETSDMENSLQNSVFDPNIYDDSDFYHQQLRELIEYKSNSSSNLAEVTKQMVELQKIRQKMKKQVDTRASKGRKIRYVVHNKLINFMAPDDSDSVNWTNESKDELFKSLFAT